MSGSNQIEGGAVDNAMGGQLLYTSYTITMGRLQENNAQIHYTKITFCTTPYYYIGG